MRSSTIPIGLPATAHPGLLPTQWFPRLPIWYLLFCSLPPVFVILPVWCVVYPMEEEEGQGSRIRELGDRQVWASCVVVVVTLFWWCVAFWWNLTFFSLPACHHVLLWVGLLFSNKYIPTTMVHGVFCVGSILPFCVQWRGGGGMGDLFYLSQHSTATCVLPFLVIMKEGRLDFVTPLDDGLVSFICGSRWFR